MLGRAVLSIPTAAPTVSSQIDHNQTQNLAVGDAHPHYALLAGRAGGQVLVGGTAVGNELRLRGSSDAGLGFVRIQSPVRFNALVDGADPDGPKVDYSPSYTAPDGGFFFESFLRVAPAVLVSNDFYLFQGVSVGGSWVQNIAPNVVFDQMRLFDANPTFSSLSTANRTLSPVIVNAIPILLRNLTGSGAATTLVAGMRFGPQTAATISGATMNVTDQAAVIVAPTWNTVAGATVNLGTIRGLWIQPPATVLGGTDAGTENITAIRAVSFDNLGVQAWNNTVVHSDQVAGTNNRFLRNLGGARSEDAGEYRWITGGRPVVLQDGVGLQLGVTDTWIVAREASVSGLGITAGSTGFRLRIRSLPDWEIQDAAGPSARRLRMHFDRMIFGSADSTPIGFMANRFFQIVAPVRATQNTGGWNDVRFDSDHHALTVNHALTQCNALVVQSQAITIGTGSIQNLQTVRIEGPTTAHGSVSNQALWIFDGRARFGGLLNFDAQTIALTADTDDLAIGTGTSARAVVELTADGDYDLSGIVPGQGGDFLWLRNADDAQTITLTHEDAGSAAANRFNLPGAASVVLGPGDAVPLWYSPTLTRWAVLSSV